MDPVQVLVLLTCFLIVMSFILLTAIFLIVKEIRGMLRQCHEQPQRPQDTR